MFLYHSQSQESSGTLLLYVTCRPHESASVNGGKRGKFIIFLGCYADRVFHSKLTNSLRYRRSDNKKIQDRVDSG